MRKPLVATSVSAIAMFAVGVVAGQMGRLPLTFAANRAAVGVNAGPSSGGAGITAQNRRAFSQSNGIKTTNLGTHTTAQGNLGFFTSCVKAMTTMAAGDMSLAISEPRGPPHEIT